MTKLDQTQVATVRRASLSVVPLDRVPTIGAVTFPMLMRFRSMAVS